MNPKETALAAAKAADAKKASDIVVLDINRLTTMGDYFVICTGGSATQIKAIADEVERSLAEAGMPPLHIEGYSSASWILIDYGSVVVHIFHRDTRAFYALERLWADAARYDLAQFSQGSGENNI